MGSPDPFHSTAVRAGNRKEPANQGLPHTICPSSWSSGSYFAAPVPYHSSPAPDPVALPASMLPWFSRISVSALPVPGRQRYEAGSRSLSLAIKENNRRSKTIALTDKAKRKLKLYDDALLELCSDYVRATRRRRLTLKRRTA